MRWKTQRAVTYWVSTFVRQSELSIIWAVYTFHVFTWLLCRMLRRKGLGNEVVLGELLQHLR